jgi:hypothetical protein
MKLYNTVRVSGMVKPYSFRMWTDEGRRFMYGVRWAVFLSLISAAVGAGVNMF